jgi:hypothetical protein
VIFDHGNFNRAERDRLRAVARQFGAAVQFAYVPITPQESRRRWQTNRETHERNDIRDEDFETALRMFEDPSSEPDVTDFLGLGLPSRDDTQ